MRFHRSAGERQERITTSAVTSAFAGVTRECGLGNNRRAQACHDSQPGNRKPYENANANDYHLH
jgi:hypothetical protein